MGSKLSTCLTKKKKKKTKKKERIQYSPRTEQELYNARRTGKLIYPPVSSIPDEEPKRSVLPDGQLLYRSVPMDTELSEVNRRYESSRHDASSYFPNHHNQYNDGTFAVLARPPMNNYGIFRV